MCKLKSIEYNKDATEGHSMIVKTEYISKTEDDSFEAVVTVFQFKETPAYIGKIYCRKGGDKLQGYVFWDNLQSEVLKFHNNRNQ